MLFFCLALALPALLPLCDPACLRACVNHFFSFFAVTVYPVFFSATGQVALFKAQGSKPFCCHSAEGLLAATFSGPFGCRSVAGLQTTAA